MLYIATPWERRLRWKTIQTPSNIDIFVCRVCRRLCVSLTCLHSHNWTHAIDWRRDPSYRRVTPYIIIVGVLGKPRNYIDNFLQSKSRNWDTLHIFEKSKKKKHTFVNALFLFVPWQTVHCHSWLKKKKVHASRTNWQMQIRGFLRTAIIHIHAIWTQKTKCL